MNSLGHYMRNLADRPSNGAGYIEPPHGDESACSRCSGRGWIRRQVDVGHPDFGTPLPCTCSLAKLRAHLQEQLLRQSNLGSLADITFEDLRDIPDGAVRTALEYADNPDRWLVIQGPHRSGKTYLAAAIANRRLTAGQSALFVSTADLLHELRTAFAGGADAHSDLFEQVLGAGLLILDGYAAHSPTPWAQEKLQQIFDRRERAASPTIITTSADLEDMDPFVGSRLMDNRLCRIVTLGEDRSLGAIPATLAARMTFERWDTRGNKPNAAQHQSLQVAYTEARNYAADPRGWFTLFGNVGVGKTHLAVAIAIFAREGGMRVSYFKSAAMLDFLRESYSSVGAYRKLFDAVANVSLLVLDGLGDERTTEWAHEKLLQVLEHRHDLVLPTVVTTSLDITATTGPIVSRIRDTSTGIFLRMDAPDFRIKRRR